MLFERIAIGVIVIVLILITALVIRAIESQLTESVARACLSLSFLFLSGISIAYLLSLDGDYYTNGVITMTVVVILFGVVASANTNSDANGGNNTIP